MTLAIESFEVSWLIEFVIWEIEISCFFFSRDDYAQFKVFWRRKRYRFILRVSLFSVSLSYLVYENILQGKNYPDIFTNKEFLLNIYRRFSFQTCYCGLAFVFIPRWIFRSIIVKQLGKQSVAFTSEMQLQRVKHCQGIFSSIIDSFNLSDIIFRLESYSCFPFPLFSRWPVVVT